MDSVVGLSEGTHTAILQGLDQYVPKRNTNTGKIWYGVENFSDTVSQWDDALFVFVPDGHHLSWDEYLKNPVDTLEKHKARIVGKNSGTTVEIKGSKRLESKPYIWDKETTELLAKGELGISTDFYCHVIDDRLSGSVTPNYIAVYPIKSQNEQNDLASRFMNSTKEEKMESETITIEKTEFNNLNSKLDNFMYFLKGVFTHQNSNELSLPPPPPIVQEQTVHPTYTEEMNSVKADKERLAADKESLTTELEATKASLAELQAKEQAWEEAKKAADLETKASQWSTIKQTLPAGLLHGEGKEKEIESEWLSDSNAFFLKYLSQINRSDEFLHANSAHGQTYGNQSHDEGDEKTHHIGSFDVRKQEFVV